jgi:hypothetical protein
VKTVEVLLILLLIILLIKCVISINGVNLYVCVSVAVRGVACVCRDDVIINVCVCVCM